MGSATIMVPGRCYSHPCADSKGTTPAASSRGLTGLCSFLPLPRYPQHHVVIRKVPRGGVQCAARSSVVLSSDSLLPTTADMEMDNLMAEDTPARLLALCSDLDWQESSRQLREEALGSLQKLGGGGGEGYMRLRKLESSMQQWLHDNIWEVLLLQPSPPAAAAATALDEDCLLHCVENLRFQAHLQAAQELTETVDSTFDWETAAAELHKHVQSMGDSPLQSEKRLWPLWLSASEDMAQAADHLHKEAFDNHHLQENNPYEKVTTDWMFGVLLSPMSSGLQQP